MERDEVEREREANEHWVQMREKELEEARKKEREEEEKREKERKEEEKRQEREAWRGVERGSDEPRFWFK